MAIAPTGAIYKSLSFDGEDSRNYGVYITGEAVYNAPERDVEMITIPGRNGSFALDNGRFQNIEVSYPAGIFADTEADFRQAVSDFRNFLCSRKGYVRLQDEYNPDEYRMAVYKSGLEVDPAMLKAGEFTITFDCKPQRWLTSGESAVTIANSGDTITNPTLFDASPMLKVYGYGTITINGNEIEIADTTLGQIQVMESKRFTGSTSAMVQYTMDLSKLNTGDTIAVKDLSVKFKYDDGIHDTLYRASIHSTTNASATATGGYGKVDCRVTCDDIFFTKGTGGSTTCEAVLYVVKADGGGLRTATETVVVSYNASSGKLWVSMTISAISHFANQQYILTVNPVMGNSTQTALGNPTYIDLDLGEAYNIESGETISVNNAVQIPPELPTLVAGANEITFDNTVTNLDIVPRWWKV